MLSGNFAEMTTSTPFRDLLHAANLRHGTDSFTSPPKEGVLRIFSALKNPTATAGFEPANLGTKGQHATPYHLGCTTENCAQRAAAYIRVILLDVAGR